MRSEDQDLETPCGHRTWTLCSLVCFQIRHGRKQLTFISLLRFLSTPNDIEEHLCQCYVATASWNAVLRVLSFLFLIGLSLNKNVLSSPFPRTEYFSGNQVKCSLTVSQPICKRNTSITGHWPPILCPVHRRCESPTRISGAFIEHPAISWSSSRWSVR